jgi:hypothetical protein
MGSADDHGRGRDTDGRGRVAVERVFERAATTTVTYGPGVARFGLGAVVLLAGLHKLLAPAEWTVYLAPLLATGGQSASRAHSSPSGSQSFQWGWHCWSASRAGHWPTTSSEQPIDSC